MRLLRVLTVLASSLLLTGVSYAPAHQMEKHGSGRGVEMNSLSTGERHSSPLMLAGAETSGGDYRRPSVDPSRNAPRLGSIPLSEQGPATSSPATELAPNGDRVGTYPPYFHPDGGGDRH